MKKLLLSLASLAVVMAPVVADAAQCRNSATGKFAKCGSPGAVPAAQYVAKGKTKPAAKPMTMPMPAAKPTPAATPAKPGLLSKLAPKPKAKPVVCHDAKKKFVKCGTPGAKPV